MPMLILVVSRSFTSSASGLPSRALLGDALDEDLRLADVLAHREGDDAGR